MMKRRLTLLQILILVACTNSVYAAAPPPIPPPIVPSSPAPVPAKPVPPPSAIKAAAAPPKKFKTALIAWPKNKSCVAWAAQAKTFWFKSEYPVGLNCYLQASVKDVFSSKIIHLEVPLIKFDSGEPKRDSDVYHLLGGDKQPMLMFDSDEIEEAAWTDLMSGKATKITGHLIMGGNSSPIEFAVNVYGKGEDATLEGVAKTRFTAFRLVPPRVAWGVVADVKDILDLHVLLQAKDIAGLTPPSP